MGISSLRTCVVAIFTLVTLLKSANGKAEEFVPLSAAGEGTHCDQEERISNTCLSCAALPFSFNVPLYECCSNDDAFVVCDACVNQTNDCPDKMAAYRAKLETDIQKEEQEMEKLYRLPKQSPGPVYQRRKRFGTLFMGNGNKKNNNIKRYGRLFFGKRDGYEYPYDGDWDADNNDDDGTYDVDDFDLNSFEDDLEADADDDDGEEMEKRFGRLFLNSPNYFGKRDDDYANSIASLNGQPNSDHYLSQGDDMSDMDKRYGRLYMGSSGTYLGKRSDPSYEDYLQTGDLDLAKRYGRVFLRGSGGYFGKRIDDDIDKRFGQLYLRGHGGYFGKRYTAPSDQNDLDLDKRWGRLFTGSGSYFGKRAVGSADDGLGWGDTEKRFGSLFMGSRYGKRACERLDRLHINRKFGRLFVGRLPYWCSNMSQ